MPLKLSAILASSTVVLVLVGAVLCGLLYPSTASASTTLTFSPAADAEVDASEPQTNFGTSTKIAVDADPLVRSYLRFELPELSGTVRQARLLLWSRSASVHGFAVHRVASDDWAEERITYATAPRPSSAVVDSSGPLAADSWTRVKISKGLVSSEGTLSLALTTSDTTAIDLASRDSIHRKPRLVLNVNDSPTVVDDSLSTDEDTPASVDVLSNDTDADQDPLTITTPAPGAAHGTVSCTATACAYTPHADYNGPDSFTYTVDDGYGGIASAAVDVTVTPVNDAPTGSATPANLSIDEDAAPQPVGLSGADVETSLSNLQFTLTEVPTHGVLKNDKTVLGKGDSFTGSPTDVTYEPNPDYYGSDSFKFEVTDRGDPDNCGTPSASCTAPKESDSITVPVAVAAVNDAPTSEAQPVVTDEDTAKTMTLTGTDVDGDALTFGITADPSHGTLGAIGSPMCTETTPKTCQVDLTYTPDADYNGADGFRFRFNDGNLDSPETSADLTVTEVNDAPATAADTASTDEDLPIVIDVLGNDSAGPSDESAQALAIESVTAGPSHGTAELVADGPDAGKVRYIPYADYNGSDSFTYKVCDSGTPTMCSEAHVEVNVAAVNDAPIAKDDTEFVAEDGTVVIDVADNDSPGPPDESGQTLGLPSITAAPSHGTAAVSSSDPDAGKVRYTPAPDYSGSDSFTYEICEAGADSLCDSATVTMTASRVVPTVETTPVPQAGDAADDAAIWINPSDPAGSTIIGTDKQGGIAVYDLSGRQLQYRDQGARTNNVDLRPNFPLGEQSVTLVAASDRALGNRRIVLYTVDPATGTLAGPPVGIIGLGYEPYGLCMYHSRTSGRFYVFVTSRHDVGPLVEQWELSDGGGGQVNAKMVRRFSLGTQTEGCVADDELGHLYLAEEDVGIWKYAAEPDEVRDRVLIDETGPSGHLTADVEGLTIAYGPEGAGYLLASSQGNNSYTVYLREGSNHYVRTFRVKDGNGTDGTQDTDGIDVTTANLGSSYPNGLFVAQDGSNTSLSGTANQNFKLVPLQYILQP